MSKTPVVQCPGGELSNPVLSQNEHDVTCRISGLTQRAVGSPCCGEYVNCAIWKGERERLWKSQRAVKSKQMLTADGWKDS